MPLVLAFLSVTNPENPLDKAVEYSIGLHPNTMGSLHDMEKQDEATSRSSTQSQRASKAAEQEQEKTGTPVQASKGERQEQEDSVVTLEGHENPQNWSALKKHYYILAVGLASLAVSMGISTITSATDDIEKRFHVGTTPAILPFSLFVVGLATGPAIAAPISETLGRVVIYRMMPPIYMLLLVGSGFTMSFGGLCILRFLAGTAGSPPLAIGVGTIADIYPPSKRAVPLCFFITCAFFGSGMGPVLGGFVTSYGGYPWTQWVSIFVAIAAWLCSLAMRETYQKALIKRKAKKLGIKPPIAQSISWKSWALQMLDTTIFRPVKMLILEPIVLVLSIYNAFTFSVLYIFFAAYPYVYGKQYGFNTWQTGLTFLGLVVGMIAAGFTGVVVDKYLYQPRFAKTDSGQTGLPPEYMLYTAMLGTFGVPIGLFWSAWTARPSVHWIVPTIAGGFFSWGSLTVFISVSMYLTQVFGALNGASALAANGLGRYLMSAAFPLFTVQMYECLGVAWATSLLGFISVLLLPTPFVFFVYGPWFREKSRFRP